VLHPCETRHQAHPTSKAGSERRIYSRSVSLEENWRFNFVIKPNNIDVRSPSMIVVRPVATKISSMYHVLQQLKEQLPKVVIKVGFKKHSFVDFL